MNKQKLQNLVLGLFMGMSFIGATASSRSITEHPELNQLMEDLSNIASGGPSLSYFDYHENFEAHTNSCTSLQGPETVMEKFQELISEIIEEGYLDANYAEEFHRNKEAALRSFEREILDGDSFFICQGSNYPPRAYTRLLQFRNWNYRITLSTHYED